MLIFNIFGISAKESVQVTYKQKTYDDWVEQLVNSRPEYVMIVTEEVTVRMDSNVDKVSRKTNKHNISTKGEWRDRIKGNWLLRMK